MWVVIRLTPVETVDAQLAEAREAYLRAVWVCDEPAVNRALEWQDRLLERRTELTRASR